MSHVKRKSAPRTWVVPRKGTKYLTSPYPGKSAELSMPLNLILRDVLKLSNNRKESRMLLNDGNVLVNGKAVKTEKFSVGLFDVVSIPKAGKNYRAMINEKKKFDIEEVKDSETKNKVYKVIGKTSLNGKKLQVNLFDGRNILSDEKEKMSINDSVLIDLESGKIVKYLPLKEGAKAYIFGGTHLGQTGIVGKVADKKSVVVKIKNKEYSIRPQNVYVVN